MKCQFNSVAAFLGTIAGVSLVFNQVVALEASASNPSFSVRIGRLLLLIIIGLFSAACLHLLRKKLHQMISRSSLPIKAKAAYFKYETTSYFPLLLPLLGAFGLRFPMPITVFLLMAFVGLLQLAIILTSLQRGERREILQSQRWLAVLFFVSGFAALIYQIAWQRVLFGAFGVNIESVTVIVSLFMFGLGVGCLLGGQLAKRFSHRAIQLFLICELGIAIFGVVSLPLIRSVSEKLILSNLLGISLTTYALLSIPTMFMGATLPILVDHLQRYYSNMGKSVGILYSLNTFGSAFASFLTVDVLFYFFGLQTAVYIAVACNVIVAFMIFDYTRRLEKKSNESEIDKKNAESLKTFEQNPVRKIPFSVFAFISALVGYISLSQEIIWFRIFSYITGGKPDVFSYLLGFILLGIAGGSLFAKFICEKKKSTLPAICYLLLFSGFFYFCSIPALAFVLSRQHILLWGLVISILPALDLFVAYFGALLVAFCLGAILPLLCHESANKQSSPGYGLSLIYFANIVGATAGPILTGFVLLNEFSLSQNVFLLSCVTCILSCVCMCFFFSSVKWRLIGIVGTLSGLSLLGSLSPKLYSNVFEKFQMKHGYNRQAYKYIEENRTGIVSVFAGEASNATDTVFGGGVYDGRLSLDPFNDVNNIKRAYFIAALHPHPTEVLEIGLASGAWARVVADYSPVKSLTSVEINPSYTKIIQNYPEVASLLTDPKVHIEIDDGRRWLKRNPERKFDFVLMNTIYHWRDHATNLLSREFLEMVRDHLKPGGVLYFNSTWSEDAIFTAAQVFKHLTTFQNFIAVSDSPFVLTAEEKVRNFQLFFRNGQPVFDLSKPIDSNLVKSLAEEKLEEKREKYRARTDLFCITEDNMASEFKRRDIWGGQYLRWPIETRKLGLTIFGVFTLLFCVLKLRIPNAGAFLFFKNRRS